MSDNDQTEATTETPPEGASPSTEPPSEPTAPTSSAPDAPASGKGSLKGAGLRYTESDGVPEWAVGKTADEVLKMTETLYDSVLRGETPAGMGQAPQAPSNSPNTPSQAPTQGSQPNVTPATPSPPDPDLIYTDKGEYQRQLDAWQRYQTQNAVQAASAPILKPLSRMARSQSQSDPKFADIWKRYAPEIDAAIAQNVPEQNRTDPEIWNQAAKLVAGEHWEELAQARAETVAARPADSGTVPGGGMTDTPSAPGGGIDPISRLFREDHPSVKKFKRLGKTADDIRSHAAAMGHDAETYADMLKARASITWTASGTPKDEREAAHATALSS